MCWCVTVAQIVGVSTSAAGSTRPGIASFTVTFDKPGVYGIKCTPHYGMGMVALIVVGDPSSNLKAAEAVSQPGKAKHAFEELFKKVDGE